MVQARAQDGDGAPWRTGPESCREPALTTVTDEARSPASHLQP